jgi:hypothetical protein
VKTQEEKKDTPKKEETPKPGPFSSFTFGNVSNRTPATSAPASMKSSCCYLCHVTYSNFVLGTTTTASLASTNVFQNSPLSQLSFSSIAQNSNPAPFSTPPSSKVNRASLSTYNINLILSTGFL